jgi:hypothetical protein
MGGIIDGRGNETSPEDACADGKTCVTMMVVVMVGHWTWSMVHWTRTAEATARAAGTGARAERK